MELSKKKTNRYNNYDDISGTNDEVIKALTFFDSQITRTFQKDNEAIRSGDGQNDDNIRLYNGLQGGETNLINGASKRLVVSLISLLSLSCSFTLSKMFSATL